MHLISLISSLALFWLVLSGHTDALLLGLGAVSCVLTAVICRRMNIVDHESHPHHIGHRMPRYWLALIRDTLQSCWLTVLAILHPARVQPVTRYIEAPLSSDLVKATLANSITLTPGTLTLDVLPDALRIHALSPSMFADLQRSGLIERARRLEQ